jgi:hypothetical protein
MFSFVTTLVLSSLLLFGIYWVWDMLPIPKAPKMIVACVVALLVLLYLLAMLWGAVPKPPHIF